jgi:hypothetical protein
MVAEFQERKVEGSGHGNSDPLEFSLPAGSGLTVNGSAPPREAQISVPLNDYPARDALQFLEIGSGLALDPFASTTLYSHHDAARLFSHCMCVFCFSYFRRHL